MTGLNTAALLVIAAAIALATALDHLLSYKFDPREPPLVKPTIPYIGHILGLIQHGNDYHRQLCIKHKLPIFTIPLLTSRAYIITDPDLALATQRSAKTISFTPFVGQFAKMFFNSEPRQTDLILKDLVGPNAEKGMVNVVTKAMHHTLAPGSELDEMNQKMLDALILEIERIVPSENGVEIGFYEFIKDLITIVSTDAFYGKENPFKDSKVAEGFWAMERDLIGLAMPGSKFIARGAHNGRERMVKAFEDYFSKGGHDIDGSPTIKARYHGHMKFEGVQPADNARFEIGIPLGLLANSAPTTFWTCLYAYNDPEVLSELRSELDTATTMSEDDSGIKTRTLDVSRMRDSCPLFLSLFQEVLRMRSTTVLARTTLEDVEFANRYLLKKDSLIQMPSVVTHMQETVWGADSQTFNPRRMMTRRAKKSNTASSGEKTQRLHPAGFRAFGAAPFLCPGRNFATTEILVFIAVMLARFDITPLGKDETEDGEWVIPQPRSSILVSVRAPKEDIRVRLKPRHGLDPRDKFKMIISEGGGSFPMPV